MLSIVARVVGYLVVHSYVHNVTSWRVGRKKPVLSKMAMLQSGRLYGGTDSFNPKYILTQLVVMQATFYLIFSVFLFVVFTFFGWPRYVMTMFDHVEYNATNLRGCIVDLVFLVSGFTM
eukprot:GHVS01022222.1.p1 GENE.GHVS01022222.1~~GHVS01022222.1.p1  ORF type:complete len:119 (+),score=2.46 GHVS01022222.1:222-578(+)